MAASLGMVFNARRIDVLELLSAYRDLARYLGLRWRDPLS